MSPRNPGGPMGGGDLLRTTQPLCTHLLCMSLHETKERSRQINFITKGGYILVVRYYYVLRQTLYLNDSVKHQTCISLGKNLFI